MLEQIANLKVVSKENNKSYHFSFVPVPEEALLKISIPEFLCAFQAIDGQMISLGDSGCKKLPFYFNEPELGIVKVTVTSETFGEDIDMNITFISNEEYREVITSESKDEGFLIE